MPSRPVPSDLKKLVFAWSVLITMGALWGLSFSLSRIVVLHGAHPLGVAFWICAIAGLLLLAVTAYRRPPFRLTGSLAALFVTTGLVGMVIPEAAFFYAAAHVPAGILSITVGVIPILTFVASAVIGAERFTLLRGAGVVLGSLAVVFLITPDDALPDPSQLRWVLLGFVSAASYTVLNLVLALKAPPDADSMLLTCGMFIAAGLVLVPLVSITDGFVPFHWPWGIVEWSIAGMGVANAVAWVLYFVLVDRAGPVFTSFTANMVTLFGVLWGIVIFAEQNSVWVWLSFATIMVALFIVTPRGSDSAAEKT